MSFTGEFRHTVDAKGRLIIPSRMRDELPDDRVVLTIWLDGCIAIWSSEGWRDIEGRLRAQGTSSRGARTFQRQVASSAHIDVIDKQGRITVPQPLRERAGIARDVVVIGALNHGEIWGADRWRQQQESAEEGRLEELAEDLDF